MSANDASVFFNPLEAGYAADPFPHLAELRETDPVHHSVIGRWILFRHRDVYSLLRDSELSVDDRKAIFDEADKRLAMFESATDGQLEANLSILNTDPPDHTRMRRLVSKAFTPRTIEGLRPRIQELVDEVLDNMAADGTGDVVSQLAFPLPFDVINEMLGMPEADKDAIRDWSEAIVKTLDPIITEEEIVAAVAADQAMRKHIDSVIEWKRANPAEDLLTLLIEAEEDGDRLTSAELRDQVSLLFIAGHETTVNLIGTGIYELLRHPDQLELWRDDDSIDANAIDELLRYVSPVQFSRRIATADFDVDGKTIERGAFIMAALAAANRDPEQWGDTADQLDLRRQGTNQHVSFGSGAHYCLGASLAKLEGQIAIGSFIRRFPHARVVGEPEWNGRINLRGLQKLVVDVSDAAK